MWWIAEENSFISIATTISKAKKQRCEAEYLIITLNQALFFDSNEV